MEFNKTWVVITYLKTFTSEAKESRQSNESLSAKMEFHWTRIRLIKRIYHSICLQTKLSKTVDLFCIRIKDRLLRDETDWELIMWRSIDFLTGQRGLWIIEPLNVCTVPHNCQSKTKNRTAKTNAHGKTKAILLLLWSIWFCREFFGQYCRKIFCFCREVFGFTVTVVGPIFILDLWTPWTV